MNNDFIRHRYAQWLNASKFSNKWKRQLKKKHIFGIECWTWGKSNVKKDVLDCTKNHFKKNGKTVNQLKTLKLQEILSFFLKLLKLCFVTKNQVICFLDFFFFDKPDLKTFHLKHDFKKTHEIQKWRNIIFFHPHAPWNFSCMFFHSFQRHANRDNFHFVNFHNPWMMPPWCDLTIVKIMIFLVWS